MRELNAHPARLVAIHLKGGQRDSAYTPLDSNQMCGGADRAIQNMYVQWHRTRRQSNEVLPVGWGSILISISGVVCKSENAVIGVDFNMGERRLLIGRGHGGQ
ncbi:MAG: hypothetical protein GY835_26950 [bacterium]|nr:hypothetical protein [bacterium]